MSTKPSTTSDGPRISATRALPVLIVFVVVLALLAHGPIAQLADYHAFADQRVWRGIPNAADVLSNLGFAVVGLFGMHVLWRRREWQTLGSARSGYGLFFVALLLTAFGSAWYHLVPDNARLVWDRLPIALACAGLLAAVWRETAPGSRWITPALAILAVFSVAWWRYTDLHGLGDLRPYLLIQFLPLILIPLLQWQHRAPPAERRAYAIAIALYVLAKLCELADHATFMSLALLSGHTLKHLLATLASAVVAFSFAQRHSPRQIP